MNTSSVVLWLAELPWGYSLAGRSTALLILAWVVHRRSRDEIHAGGCSCGGRRRWV